MQVLRKSWTQFKADLRVYASRDRQRRSQLIFRGHADASWPLQTTLDRWKPDFSGDEERSACLTALLREFRREAVGVFGSSEGFPVGDALELLARHHGLPSILLDWTESPYIASFFAFDGVVEAKSDSVAIWMLDRARLEEITSQEFVDIIDDRDLLRFNVRAIEQRGVFLRVQSVSKPTHELLAPALTKFVIPASERRLAMAELDEMTITAKNLFRDLAGAGRTAMHRVF